MSIDRDAEMHRQAMNLASKGHWQLAESACHRLLQVRQDRTDTLALLGVIYMRTGRTARAVEPLRRSIALDARQPLTHTMLGDAFLSLGQTPEALHSYEAALRQDTTLLPALFGRATALLDLQQFEAARTAYDEVLEHSNDYAEAWFNRGNALLALRQPTLAAESYERAIRLRPGFATALNNRGSALFELQQLEPALTSFDAAIAADPDLADAHRNRGVMLDKLGRAAESLQSFERALSLNNGDIEALYGRGKALCALNRTAEALEDAATVLTRQSNHLSALRLQGDLLSSRHRYEEAAASYSKLLRADPQSEYAAGALHHAQRWCADWHSTSPAAEAESLRLAVLAGRRADHPFSFLAVTDDPQAQLQCARTFVESEIAHPISLRPLTPYGHERIRIAYVSGDFRTHAVSYLLAGVLEKHDRRQFETIAISLRAADPSPLGRRMQGAFDKFVDVSTLTDLAAAQLIRGLEADIVVDLSGHTSPRFNILSHRPAPIQVQYIGFPGTTGASFIDYILADSFVIPAADARHYSEHIARLPDCFQANGDLRAHAVPSPSRQELGLAPDAFVFCCFNNVYKLNAAVFDVWMRVLTRVPESLLWLFAPNDAAIRNLRREAERRGVNPDRLVFADRVPYESHIARLVAADLFLDTHPFNGGATASDALWSGLPLLTHCGRSFSARMAGSLLQAIGLQTLVTYSWEAYEEKAVSLAGRTSELSRVKTRLADARETARLFDSGHFCRNLELAYTNMWQRHERGDTPESFQL